MYEGECCEEVFGERMVLLNIGRGEMPEWQVEGVWREKSVGDESRESRVMSGRSGQSTSSDSQCRNVDVLAGYAVQIYQVDGMGGEGGSSRSGREPQEGGKTAGSADQRTTCSWICWCPIVAGC